MNNAEQQLSDLTQLVKKQAEEVKTLHFATNILNLLDEEWNSLNPYIQEKIRQLYKDQEHRNG